MWHCPIRFVNDPPSPHIAGPWQWQGCCHLGHLLLQPTSVPSWSCIKCHILFKIAFLLLIFLIFSIILSFRKDFQALSLEHSGPFIVLCILLMHLLIYYFIHLLPLLECEFHDSDYLCFPDYSYQNWEYWVHRNHGNIFVELENSYTIVNG